jgi:mannose-1-phosphate guanylyltransferase
MLKQSRKAGVPYMHRLFIAEKPSVAKAMMEHTKNAALVPVDIGWNDIVAWAALLDTADCDEDGYALQGDVMVENSHNCLVSSKSEAHKSPTQK